MNVACIPPLYAVVESHGEAVQLILGPPPGVGVGVGVGAGGVVTVVGPLCGPIFPLTTKATVKVYVVEGVSPVAVNDGPPVLVNKVPFSNQA